MGPCFSTLTFPLPGDFGKIVGELAKVIGGKGGGRADMAQAGGSQPENLSEALVKIELCL